MELYYNSDDKEVVILFGYGIGSHLSLNFLKSYLDDIKKVFPELTEETLNELKFLEVADSSRRHRYHWYTRFNLELKGLVQKHKDSGYFKYKDNDIFVVTKRVKGIDHATRDETAKEVMSRMIHD